MVPIYRIVKWHETFETADSRRHKLLTWISVPLGFSSNGFARLVEDFGDESPSIYGAWIALAQIAASQPIRGILATSNGDGLTAGRFSFRSHFPSTVFAKLIEWALSEPVGWLEVVTADEFNRLLIEQQTVGNQSLNELPNPTQPNPTQPNPTQPNPDETIDRRLVDEKFWEQEGKDHEVKTVAGHIRRHVSDAKLKTDTVWLIACLDVFTSNGLAVSIIDAFKNKKIHKPQRYADVAIETCCKKFSIELQDFILAMPKLKPNPAQTATS